MKESVFSAFGRRQELVLGFFLLLIFSLLFALFAQEKLLYYLIGIIILAVLGWAQINIKRWIYLVFLFMPISPTVNVIELPTQVSTELDDYVVWMAVLVFFLNSLLQPRLRRKNDLYLLIPFSLYLIACTLTSIFGFYFHYSFLLVANSIGHLVKWASYAFIYFMIFRVFREEKDIKNLLRVILVAFSIGSIITVYRYLTHSSEIDEFYRAKGMMEGLNGYASILALLLAFYFNIILLGKSRELFPTWLMLSLWVLICLALITTFSRTAWFALWASLIFISFLQRRRYIAVTLIALALANFLLLRSPVEERIKQTFEKQEWSSLPVDLGGREIIWRTGLKRIGSKYLIGVGYSNFSQVLMGTTAHNQYLAILGESGVPGLVTFFYLIYRLIKALLFLSRRHPHPFFRECAFASLIGLVVILVISFALEYFYMSPGIAVLLAFYASARLSFQMEMEKRQSPKPSMLLHKFAYR